GATVVALLSPNGNWFYVVFFLVGANTGTEMMARYNFAGDCSTESTRVMYVGVMNVCLVPCYVVNLGAGWLVEHFNVELVFVVGIICSSLGLVSLATVSEPRQTRQLALSSK
ncbi:MAG: hypothetical protein HY966_06050, partial [Ignavibacteriales bacterium]|nr:hypothetical protein [Ignavibacteriales bacterium]